MPQLRAEGVTSDPVAMRCRDGDGKIAWQVC